MSLGTFVAFKTPHDAGAIPPLQESRLYGLEDDSTRA